MKHFIGSIIHPETIFLFFIFMLSLIFYALYPHVLAKMLEKKIKVFLKPMGTQISNPSGSSSDVVHCDFSLLTHYPFMSIIFNFLDIFPCRPNLIGSPMMDMLKAEFDQGRANISVEEYRELVGNFFAHLCPSHPYSVALSSCFII